VYDYWVDKRKRLGKPIMRRLQMPPFVTDPNPFAVFRPREKLHRHGRLQCLVCLRPAWQPR
jgi:enhancer of polycomb-like protein